MRRVFVDSDVILDFLLNREPYIEEITEIIERSIDGELALSVSSISITNLHYIIGRIENRTKAHLKTKKILQLVRVENVGQSAIIKAINSKFKDFEDGVQNYCAEESKHDTIITRNVRDYKQSELVIMTPKEFLINLRNI